MKLPTNKEMLEDIKLDSGRKTDWNLILDPDPQSIYRLLYSLQIIDQLMQPSDAQKEADVQWSQNFLYSGGFQRVFEIFTSSKFDERYETGGAWRLCMPLLLKIINLFMKSDVTLQQTFSAQNRDTLKHSGETFKRTVDLPTFIRMMITLISSISSLGDTQSMEPAVSLLVASLLSRKDLLGDFYEIPRIREFVLGLLLEASNPDIRRRAADGFYLLCQIPSV